MTDITAAEVAALVVELRDPPEHVLPGIAGRAAKAIEQLQRALLDAAERVAAAELSPGRCPRCKETLIRVDPEGDAARRLGMLNTKGGDGDG